MAKLSAKRSTKVLAFVAQASEFVGCDAPLETPGQSSQAGKGLDANHHPIPR